MYWNGLFWCVVVAFVIKLAACMILGIVVV